MTLQRARARSRFTVAARRRGPRQADRTASFWRDGRQLGRAAPAPRNSPSAAQPRSVRERERVGVGGVEDLNARRVVAIERPDGAVDADAEVVRERVVFWATSW